MKLLSNDIMPAIGKLNRDNKLEFVKRLLIEEMTSDKMDSLLELLLDAMKLVFVFNGEFRKNINTFSARYTFRIGINGTGATIIFKPIKAIRYGRMIVENEPLDNADVSVNFESGKAMAEFLFSPNPDIFGALLDNKLSFSGNLNYLFKFAYMAKHLPKALGIPLPT